MNSTDKLINCILSILSVFRILLSSKIFFKRRKSQKGNTLHILGNGPSLSLLDISALPRQIMVVNNFAVHPYFENIKPEYYLLNAPEYWIDNVDEEYLQMREKLMLSFSEKVSWKMILFLPYSAKKSSFSKQISTSNKNITIEYYNTTPIEGITPISLSLFSMQLGMPRPHNVLIPALMNGIWMKFSNINIYGADHSWMQEIVVDKNNVVYLTQKHFYDAENATPEVMKKLGKGQRKLHEVLEKFYLAFKGYHQIQKLALKSQVKIYNFTQNSFIDAFEKR